MGTMEIQYDLEFQTKLRFWANQHLRDREVFTRYTRNNFLWHISIQTLSHGRCATFLKGIKGSITANIE